MGNSLCSIVALFSLYQTAFMYWVLVTLSIEVSWVLMFIMCILYSFLLLLLLLYFNYSITISIATTIILLLLIYILSTTTTTTTTTRFGCVLQKELKKKISTAGDAGI